MSSSTSPLIQTLNPERWAGLSMDFIGTGCVGLLVKNGRLVRQLTPGRHFSFALPLLEQCQLVLVDTKIRNLEVLSQGDFLSRDQYLVNVSLSVMYQVVDPGRVALELSDAIAALTSAVKDSLGVVVNQLRLDQLTQQGRVQIRQHLLDNANTFYALGFNLEDVRISDISFPQTRGVIRQVEGMSAREEAEHEAALKLKMANAERTAHVQQINISANPIATPLPNAEATIALGGKTAPSELPAAQDRLRLAPTILTSGHQTAARLVHRATGAIVSLSANPFTIGREPHNHLVWESPLCSRDHAQIEQIIDAQGNHYQLTDMGSSNGTFLNNQRLTARQPAVLTPGSLVRIGTDEWIFQA
jgi:regulator of protease activity HflC (stomatin/prohibitin superfamily)